MLEDYDIDENYAFEYDKYGCPYFPKGCTRDKDGLYILPNGKYLPDGVYLCDDGSTLLYEPWELDPMYWLAVGIPDSDEDDDFFEYEDEEKDSPAEPKRQ